MAKVWPTFSPEQYHNAVAEGMTYKDMQANIAKRADQIAGFVRDRINGSVLWSLPDLFAEAEAVRAYRQAFTDWLLDMQVSPLNEKRGTGCPVCHGVH